MELLVCICGAGTMGRGIARALASFGIDTILYDVNAAMLSAAATQIQQALDTDVEKKRLTAGERLTFDQHLSFTSSLKDCRAPLIIEAIAEIGAVKVALFQELAALNSPETVFATNTSSLSVTDIAAATAFPERIIGMHFFNPANRMQLVEIVKTNYVSELLVQRFVAFSRQINKTPVVCQDHPGFIVNHVARPYYLEALRLAEQEAADIGTIDRLMQSAGFKMGPFHLMDLIGNDINYAVSVSLYESLGKPKRLKPSVMQESKVKQGLLGEKTGGGFFSYPPKKSAL